MTLFGKEFKIGQFADETPFFCGDKGLVRRAIEVLNEFSNLSACD